jgi:proton-dependent oligopeptide transporter, POT family
MVFSSPSGKLESNSMFLEDRGTFGHPGGLFALFFAEMWERFSYYGMRALLVFYMIKGFLGYGDKEAYAVYGAYTALVYMTPFFGGLLADRLLGQRRAVILGGLLMASGHLMMTIENSTAFFTALALLIVGNGFFKPNISTIVGALYPPGSPKRDGGFTIFYMGINLGAAMSPLLCGYVGETYGWHYGFGLATIGMLLGLAVFVNWIPPGSAGAPPKLERLRQRPVYVSQALVLLGAFAAATALIIYRPTNYFSISVNIFVAVALVMAGIVACLALRHEKGGFITLEWATYGATIVSVPVIVLFVSGFAPLRADGKALVIVPDKYIFRLQYNETARNQLDALEKAIKKRAPDAVSKVATETQSLLGESRLALEHTYVMQKAIVPAIGGDWESAKVKLEEVRSEIPKTPFKSILAVLLQESSKPAGFMLVLAGIIALGYLGYHTFRLDLVPRQRMYVALILTFFSMLFWAFFEQAGSSVNNFTDRNVDRVVGESTAIADQDVGRIVELQPTQSQLGYSNGGKQFTLTDLDQIRDNQKAVDASKTDFTIPWTVSPDNIGMQISEREREIPASVFQAVNPVCILVFGLLFTALWMYLGKRGLEPSTPIKFALGLLQLALGFGAFWYGAQSADDRGMVVLGWLLLGYLLQTTGELCLSPVGLSMITKLSPGFLVSTMMGMWFLATAYSQFLAAMIAQFTGVGHGGEDSTIPIPSETVSVYGEVFGNIAITAMISGVICLALAPLLKRWMHQGADAPGSGHH